MYIKKTIRVILADDHPAIRRGIRRILGKCPDFLVVGEADTGADAIQLVHELKPDVLLLDMEMPDMRGIQVAHELRIRREPVSIVILSACDDDHFIEETLQMGVDGYLNKDESPARIRGYLYRISAKHVSAFTPFLVFLLPKMGWALLQILSGSPFDVGFL